MFKRIIILLIVITNLCSASQELSLKKILEEVIHVKPIHKIIGGYLSSFDKIGQSFVIPRNISLGEFSNDSQFLLGFDYENGKILIYEPDNLGNLKFKEKSLALFKNSNFVMCNDELLIHNKNFDIVDILDLSKNLVKKKFLDKRVKHLFYSRDKQDIIFILNNNRVEVISRDNYQKINELEIGKFRTDTTFSLQTIDSKKYLFCLREQNITVWDLATKKLVISSNLPNKIVEMTFFKNYLIIITQRDMYDAAEVIDLKKVIDNNFKIEKSSLVREINNPNYRDMILSQNGEFLGCRENEKIKVYDSVTGQLIVMIKIKNLGEYHRFSLPNDGRFLFLKCTDSTKVFDIKNRKQLYKFNYRIIISPNNKFILEVLDYSHWQPSKKFQLYRNYGLEFEEVLK